MSNLPIVPMTKHQEHVVAHVLGCAIVATFHAPGHLHLLLDIPFLWSIDADGAMALVQDEEALTGLDATVETIGALLADLGELRADGTDVSLFEFPPEIGTIEDVHLHAHPAGGDARLLVIHGDAGDVEIELSAGMVKVGGRQ